MTWQAAAQWLGTIGDIGRGNKNIQSEQTDTENTIVGNVNQFIGKVSDILFAYTERIRKESDGRKPMSSVLYQPEF